MYLAEIACHAATAETERLLGMKIGFVAVEKLELFAEHCGDFANHTFKRVKIPVVA